MGAPRRARDGLADFDTRWRGERDGVRPPRPRDWFDETRSFEETRSAPPQEWPAESEKSTLERGILLFSAVLVVTGGICCFWLLQSDFSSSTVAPPSQIVLQDAGNSFGSRYAAAQADDSTGAVAMYAAPSAPLDRTRAAASPSDAGVAPRTAGRLEGGDTAAGLIARVWSALVPQSKPVRVASLGAIPPRIVARPPVMGVPETKTALVEFDSAPFPSAGGRVYGRHGVYRRVNSPYTDRHVLLHIPKGFDANRPSVMVVFFHGHRAMLGRDVRDRQQLPAQITASGLNAVLVAPQFAFNAADSSAGKFGESGGFARFMDETAKQLATLQGDPNSQAAFAKMPIVLVAYSGGFGPTLAVLDRGGVKGGRIKGLVLLDALYSGMDRFASWIASNRNSFFVSAYTAHNGGRNAELRRMLTQRNVPFGTELKPDQLQGSVTFLSTPDVSHTDFLTHAWADLPVKNLLVRMTEYSLRANPQQAALPAGAAR